MQSTPFKVRHGIIVETSNATSTVIAANNQVLTGSSSTSLIDLATTWNTTGNPTAFKLNVTNTASGASSALMNLLVGGTSRFFVSANGNVGIGVLNPLAALEVGGQALFQGTTNPQHRGAKVGVININNNTSDGTVDFTQGIIFTDNIGGAGTWTHAGIVSVGSSGYNGSLVFGTDGDSLQNTTGITEKMRITSAGNVGIGTVSPSAKFHVVGDGFFVADSTAGAQLQIRGATDTNNRLYIGYNTADNTGRIQAITEGNAYRSLILQAGGGNVGIGTTTTTGKLNIDTTTDGLAVRIAAISSTGSEVNLGVGVLNAGSPFVGTNTNSNAFDFGTRAYTSIRFYTNSTEKMRLGADGNVGIGTTSPGSILQAERSVNGQLAVIVKNVNTGSSSEATFLADNGTYRAGFGVAGTSKSAFGAILPSDAYVYSDVNAVGSGITIMSNAANGVIKFATGGSSERMRISNDGNVGIGTTNPSYKLHVAGSAYFPAVVAASTSPPLGILLGSSGAGAGFASPSLTFDIGGGGGGAKIYTTRLGGAGGRLIFATDTTSAVMTERMLINESGNVGIGTTAPTSKLTVVGSTDGSSALFTSGLDNNHITLGAAVNFGSDNNTQNKWSIRWRGRPTGSLHHLAFYDELNAAERMRIDNNGNIGVGVTPSAWGASYKAIELASGTSIMSLGTSAYFGANFYHNGSNYIYKNTGPSYMYAQDASGHIWYTAASGTGGNIISYSASMLMNTSGNLGIGTTTPTSRLHVFGTSGVVAEIGEISAAGIAFHIRASALPTTGTRANIGWLESASGFSAGSLLLGARPAVGSVVLSSSGAADVVVNTSGRVGVGTISPAEVLHIHKASSNVAQRLEISPGNLYTGEYQFGIVGYGVVAGMTYSDTTKEFRIWGVNNSNFQTFYTANVERMRISNDGNVGIGTSAPSEKLEVAGRIRLNNGVNTTNYISTPASQDFQLEFGTINQPDYGTRTVKFSVIGGGYVRIDYGGSGTYQYDVYGSVWHMGYAGLSFTNAGGSGGTYPMVFTSTNGFQFLSGNVGIGFAPVAGQGALQVKVASGYAFKFSQASTYALLAANDEAGTNNVDLRIASKDVTFATNGSVMIGVGAIGTTATSGFLYIPSCAGVPTGTPTAQTGRVPLVVDSTNNKLYMYSGGAWVALN